MSLLASITSDILDVVFFGMSAELADTLEIDLVDAGYSINPHSTATADDLKRIVADNTCKLIFCEYGFSFEQALEVKQNQSLNIPLIIVSEESSVSRSEVAGSIRKGAADFLTKEDLVCLGPIVLRELEEEQMRSEQRQIEYQLQMDKQEGEAILSAIADAAPATLWMTDKNGDIIFLNKQWTDFTGLSMEESVGQGWLDALHPDDRQQTAQQYFESFESRQIYQIDYRLKRQSDNAYRWCTATGAPRFASDGSFAGYAGSCLDIHDRKETEQLLVKQQRQQQAVTDVGFLSLSKMSLDELMSKTAQTTAETLDVRFVKIIEHIPSRQTIVFTAIYGFKPELAGQEVILDGEPHAGYTLKSKHPVIVKNILTETRFKCSPLHEEYGLISGISVLIHTEDSEQPYGVLEADSDSERYFTGDDIRFMQSLANKLGMSIERRRAEDALIKSEEKFRTMADNIPNLAWMANANGWISWYNRRWYEYTGTSEKDMEGWGWQSVHNPKTLPQVMERWQASIATGQSFSMVFPLRGKDKKFKPFLTLVTAVRNDCGEIIRWFGTNTDISDLQAMQAALNETEEKFRMITEAMPQLVWSALPDGFHDYYNQRWYEYTGATPQETAGDGWNVQFHPDDQERAREVWKHSLQTGEPYVIEYRLRRADGVYRWVLGRALPLRNERGVISRWFGTCTDIQDIMDAREAQTRAVEMAEETSRRKSQFLANMSHELRTPLNAIIGYSDMLKGGLAGDLSERQQRYTNHIASSGRHLLSLVNGLLDLSKIEAGKMELHLEMVELHPLLADLRMDMQAIAAQRSIILQFSLHPNLDVVYADPIRLKQILLNLLSNAVKFNREGGSITINAQQSSDGQWVEFTVSDTGIGISKDKLSELFQEFHQIDAGVNRRQEGTGLGLALTKHLVEMHGGTIKVESEEQVGSAFTFTLPVN